MKNLKLLAITLALGSAVLGSAQNAPPAINYQGRLTQSTGVVVPDGLTGMRVRIFATASGGSALWDSGDLSVATKSGTFSILLGSGGMPAMSPAVFAMGTVYIEVQPTDQSPLLPRQPIASVPWAFHAQTVSDNSISSAKLMSDQTSLEKVTGGLATISGGRLLINQTPILGSAMLDVKGWIRSDTSDAAHPAQVQFNDSGNNDAGTVGLTSEGGSFVGIAGGKGAGWGVVMNTTTGNVGIGAPDPQAKLQVGGPAHITGALGVGFPTNPTGYPLQLGSATPAIAFHLNNSLDRTGSIVQGGPYEMSMVVGPTWPPAGRFIFYTNRVDVGGELYVSPGNAFKPGGGQWADISDIRLKKNIATIDSPLATLLRLHGVTFEFRDPIANDQRKGRQTGFIAQEVERIFPQWVMTGSDGYKSIGLPMGFSAMTVEAIREQQSTIEQLRRELQLERAARLRTDREVAELKRLIQIKK